MVPLLPLCEVRRDLATPPNVACGEDVACDTAVEVGVVRRVLSSKNFHATRTPSI
jgi:hypothetical protein